MSIKSTKIFYPHIVKEYASVEEFITENNYTEFYNEQKATLVTAGIDINDDTKYKENLSEDSFEAILTVVFASQEARDAYVAAAGEPDPSNRQPIFIEETDDHII
jgi:hypothetical protein